MKLTIYERFEHGTWDVTGELYYDESNPDYYEMFHAKDPVKESAIGAVVDAAKSFKRWELDI